MNDLVDIDVILGRYTFSVWVKPTGLRKVMYSNIWQPTGGTAQNGTC